MSFGLFVDIFVILVLLASVGIAFVRGFIREVLTVFGIFGGILAAYILGPLLQPVMRGWFGVEENAEDPQKLFDLVPYWLIADILAYGSILIIFIIILSIISHFIAEFVRNIGLGALDRTLGVVFGLVRAAIVLGLIYLPFHFILGDEQKEEWFKGSKTQIYLVAVAEAMIGFMPEDVAKKVEEGAKDGAEALEEKGSETRKKLEELDVLQSDGEENKDSQNNPKNDDKKDGYGEEFRDRMDQLIEDSINNNRSPNE